MFPCLSWKTLPSGHRCRVPALSLSALLHQRLSSRCPCLATYPMFTELCLRALGVNYLATTPLSEKKCHLLNTDRILLFATINSAPIETNGNASTGFSFNQGWEFCAAKYNLVCPQLWHLSSCFMKAYAKPLLGQHLWRGPLPRINMGIFYRGGNFHCLSVIDRT